MKKGLSSNSSPKTFGFIFPQIGRPCITTGLFWFCAPYLRENQLKVFGKGVRGDSPQCGEMSRSDRGARLRQRRTFPQKGFPPIICYNILY